MFLFGSCGPGLLVRVCVCVCECVCVCVCVGFEVWGFEGFGARFSFLQATRSGQTAGLAPMRNPTAKFFQRPPKGSKF